MSEEDLVKRLRKGEPRAKEELAALHYRRLYATACHVLGYRDEEVEDVVQDSFAAALKSVDRFEGRSSLYTWLNHICVNQCFERLRQRRRQLLMESGSLELLLQPKAQSAQQDAEAEAIKEERLGRLKALLAALGEPCGELLRWRYQQGLSLNEIKERLRAPLGTVTARLYRCLSALRRQAEGSLS